MSNKTWFEYLDVDLPVEISSKVEALFSTLDQNSIYQIMQQLQTSNVNQKSRKNFYRKSAVLPNEVEFLRIEEEYKTQKYMEVSVKYERLRKEIEFQNANAEGTGNYEARMKEINLEYSADIQKIINECERSVDVISHVPKVVAPTSYSRASKYVAGKTRSSSSILSAVGKQRQLLLAQIELENKKKEMEEMIRKAEQEYRLKLFDVENYARSSVSGSKVNLIQFKFDNNEIVEQLVEPMIPVPVVILNEVRSATQFENQVINESDCFKNHFGEKKYHKEEFVDKYCVCESDVESTQVVEKYQSQESFLVDRGDEFSELFDPSMIFETLPSVETRSCGQVINLGCCESDRELRVVWNSGKQSYADFSSDVVVVNEDIEFEHQDLEIVDFEWCKLNLVLGDVLNDVGIDCTDLRFDAVVVVDKKLLQFVELKLLLLNRSNNYHEHSSKLSRLHLCIRGQREKPAIFGNYFEAILDVNWNWEPGGVKIYHDVKLYFVLIVLDLWPRTGIGVFSEK